MAQPIPSLAENNVNGPVGPLDNAHHHPIIPEITAANRTQFPFLYASNVMSNPSQALVLAFSISCAQHIPYPAATIEARLRMHYGINTLRQAINNPILEFVLLSLLRQYSYSSSTAAGKNAIAVADYQRFQAEHETLFFRFLKQQGRTVEQQTELWEMDLLLTHQFFYTYPALFIRCVAHKHALYSRAWRCLIELAARKGSVRQARRIQSFVERERVQLRPIADVFVPGRETQALEDQRLNQLSFDKRMRDVLESARDGWVEERARERDGAKLCREVLGGRYRVTVVV